MIKVHLKRVSATSGEYELELSLDQDGLRVLSKQFEWLESGKDDHFHLMHSDWGQDDFDREKDSLKLSHIKVQVVEVKQ